MVKLQGWVKWGLGNEPRNVILYFARRLTRKKLEEIGKEFTIRNYSAASSVQCKISRQIQTNKELRRRITQPEGLLLCPL